MVIGVHRAEPAAMSFTAAEAVDDGDRGRRLWMTGGLEARTLPGSGSGAGGRDGRGEGARSEGTSMSRYEVDSEQVARASGAVQTSAGRISGEVDGMMRHLLDLQNSWKGQAATSFQHVVTDWRATQERVRASLEEIQRALAVAGQQYAQAEDAATRMFAR